MCPGTREEGQAEALSFLLSVMDAWEPRERTAFPEVSAWLCRPVRELGPRPLREGHVCLEDPSWRLAEL